MLTRFSPSQNILLNNFIVALYQVTPNAQQVFDTIVNNHQSGLRSMNIIGAYGTGKSSFLNALNYHFNEEKLFVEGREWKKYPKVEIDKIVGAYESIVEQVGQLVGLERAKPIQIVEALEAKIKRINKSGKGYFLMIDEFGKFLEYAAQHQAEKELYFLQQVAEVINNTALEALMITTLHQDFAAYAVNLSLTQRNEWTKVKGRFKELNFNEPVEQLLYLASQSIQARPEKVTQSEIVKLGAVIAKAKAFPLRDYFNVETAERIFPLDLLSGGVLLLALQEYGQNERSLFTFLYADSLYSLNDFKEKRPHYFYAVAQVYDYLNYNLNAFINSKANVHYAKWGVIKNALERVEGEVIQVKHHAYFDAIKTIGLLNLFSPAAAILDDNFLIQYLAITSGASSQVFEEILTDLQKRNLLDYNKYSKRFFFTESTPVDLEEALEDAGSELGATSEVVLYLNNYLHLAPISAKRAYFAKGTPRVFEYQITDQLFTGAVKPGPIDGYINLVFNSSVQDRDLETTSAAHPHILYAIFHYTADISNTIQEIRKAEIAKEKYAADRIIQRELNLVIDMQKNLLNHFVLDAFYNRNAVSWWWNGEPQELDNARQLNSFLTTIVEQVYTDTPTFINELANKTKLSPSISTARKNLIDAILQNEDQEGLGIKKSPPEKSIYLSLLRQTGIHAFVDGVWKLQDLSLADHDDTKGFRPLFDACNQFILGTKGAKRTVSELYELLEGGTFKLKRGFLDFWVPILLLMKSDDFALYGQNGFIPEIDAEVLELLVKNPQQYAIKAFDTEGVKIQLFNQYRDFLAMPGEQQTSNDAFIKTIIPFIKFYRDLKPYVKQTKRISKKAIQIRKALTDATDPEKLFFDDFPNALGYDTVQLGKIPELLQDFSVDLQQAIRDLRSAYDDLLNKFESMINSLWNESYSFQEYKSRLRTRYQGTLKQYLLLPYQRTFYDRLCSPLEDRAGWLSSIAQACVGKTLDQFKDDDVEKLQERFHTLIHELDNLNKIAKTQVNLEQEDAFHFEITSPGEAPLNQNIQYAKKRDAQFNALENKLIDLLENESKSTKLVLLAHLLKQELNKDASTNS